MLDSIAVSALNLRGIPVTEPFEHPMEARESLTKMTLTYPGEIFNIEFLDDESSKAVVTWIPKSLIGQLLSNAVTASAMKPWGASDQF